jgi:hypothetical protein
VDLNVVTNNDVKGFSAKLVLGHCIEQCLVHSQFLLKFYYFRDIASRKGLEA